MKYGRTYSPNKNYRFYIKKDFTKVTLSEIFFYMLFQYYYYQYKFNAFNKRFGDIKVTVFFVSSNLIIKGGKYS